MGTIQKVYEFVLKYKNAVTNAVGFLFALAIFLQEFFLSNEKPKLLNLLTALVVWCVAYFTGKKKV